MALDGRDEALLDWITQTGLVALIADNYAVEAHPARACSGGTLRVLAAARSLLVPFRRVSGRNVRN